MGAILELPEAADGWHVEARAQSFYLGADGWNAYRFGEPDATPPVMHVHRDETPPPGGDIPWHTVLISLDEIDAAAAAVEYVLDHMRLPHEPAEPTTFTAALDPSGAVALYGPCFAYPGQDATQGPVPCGTIEVEYRDAAALRQALGPWMSTTTSHHVQGRQS